jgi:transposase-like protein
MFEVTIRVQCCHCDSENIIRNGMTRNGKQRYKCRDCGRTSRDNPTPPGYSEAEKAVILRAYEERSSLRGLQRTFGVNRATVSRWLEKKTPSS